MTTPDAPRTDSAPDSAPADRGVARDGDGLRHVGWVVESILNPDHPQTQTWQRLHPVIYRDRADAAAELGTWPGVRLCEVLYREVATSTVTPRMPRSGPLRYGYLAGQPGCTPQCLGCTCSAKRTCTHCADDHPRAGERG